MPTRMVRDWTDSLKFDGISADAERLYLRLLVKADDYGRFHAEPRLIKAAAFPLFDNLRTNDLTRWLDELSTRQLILRYQVDGREYLAIPNYGQRLKNSREKFPPLPGSSEGWLCSSEDFQRLSGNVPDLPGSSGNVRPEEKRSEGKGRRRETEYETEEESPKPPEGAGDIADDGFDGIFPPGALRRPAAEQRATKILRNTPEMERIGQWFGRKPSTLWTVTEAISLQRLKPSAEDLGLLAEYYEAHISDQQDYRRRDVQTLLNNWSSELDRAVGFLNRESHP